MDDNKRHMWQMAMSPDPIALTIREKTEQYFPGRQPLRLRRAAYAPFGRLALAPLSADKRGVLSKRTLDDYHSQPGVVVISADFPTRLYIVTSVKGSPRIPS